MIIYIIGTPLHILRESMKSAASMTGANQEGRELVNNMRQRIVENFQERMQLRRSLIELEDQNVIYYISFFFFHFSLLIIHIICNIGSKFN